MSKRKTVSTILLVLMICTVMAVIMNFLPAQPTVTAIAKFESWPYLEVMPRAGSLQLERFDPIDSHVAGSVLVYGTVKYRLTPRKNTVRISLVGAPKSQVPIDLLLCSGQKNKEVDRKRIKVTLDNCGSRTVGICINSEATKIGKITYNKL